MSLQAADGARYFLSAHEIELAVDGVIRPIDYQGRRYVYSHTTSITGYDPEAREELYVFREVAAASETAL